MRTRMNLDALRRSREERIAAAIPRREARPVATKGHRTETGIWSDLSWDDDPGMAHFKDECYYTPLAGTSHRSGGSTLGGAAYAVRGWSRGKGAGPD
ncbi:MAG: hypothetical protein NVS9B4_00590 [Candidatus Acidiferrum sp.]